MTRTPIELAAIASAAVPGLTPTGVAAAPDDAADFQSAVLLDDGGKRWRVRSPKHAEASVRLETELHVLRCFTPAVRTELPFLLPNVAGTVRQGNLSTFVYSHVPGSTRTIDELAAEPGNIAAELGRVMAAIHDLPLDLVHSADLPSYSANEFRQRKLNELDQAATTGKIPSALLLRWENALEDIALWQFHPSVVHGDLHEDHLLIHEGRVTGVNGWTDMRVGDPADDFAWLIAANDQTFADSVLESYSVAVQRAPDRHLLRRAALSAEFALAQWLVRGISINDPAVIAEAEEMLATLESDIAQYGGQPISADPPQRQHSPAVAPINTDRNAIDAQSSLEDVDGPSTTAGRAFGDAAGTTTDARTGNRTEQESEVDEAGGRTAGTDTAGSPASDTGREADTPDVGKDSSAAADRDDDAGSVPQRPTDTPHQRTENGPGTATGAGDPPPETYDGGGRPETCDGNESRAATASPVRGSGGNMQKVTVEPVPADDNEAVRVSGNEAGQQERVTRTRI